jgi:hypothetical protein
VGGWKEDILFDWLGFARVCIREGVIDVYKKWLLICKLTQHKLEKINNIAHVGPITATFLQNLRLCGWPTRLGRALQAVILPLDAKSRY